MYDFRYTYFTRTLLSSQFLGLKQGNWAKYVTVHPPISKKPYYQVNFLGWSRAIGQNVWLSIHLFRKNHIIKSISWVEGRVIGQNVCLLIHLFHKNPIIKSISWVEAGQLGKMYDFRFTYFKRTIYFRLMFNTIYFHSPQLFITNVQIRRENYNIKSISWVEAGQ